MKRQLNESWKNADSKFLNPLSLTKRELADAVMLTYRHINELVNQQRAVTLMRKCGSLSLVHYALPIVCKINAFLSA